MQVNVRTYFPYFSSVSVHVDVCVRGISLEYSYNQCAFRWMCFHWAGTTCRPQSSWFLQVSVFLWTEWIIIQVSLPTQETTQTLPSYRPQPTRRKKPAEPLTKSPALYSVALFLFHVHPFFPLSLCCVNHSLSSPLSKAFTLPPPHFSPFIFLSFCVCIFLDHRKTWAENKLFCEWKWLNKIGSIKTFHLWVQLW